MRAYVLAFLIPLALALSASADPKPAPIFTKGMVLQRGMTVPVWGTAAPEEEITVSFLKQTKKATADKDGKWMVKLDSLEAGGPYKMKITGKKSVELDDILVGEVWLCSGQSNMGWRLSQSANAKAEAASADYPKIRYTAGPNQPWVACSPKNAGSFSACAYYFGRDLHKALKVPVGLVHRSVGGTSARRWVSLAAMKAEPAMKPFVETIEKQMSVKPPKGKRGPGGVGDLYKGFIQPLEGFAIKGAIWYQGESDAGRPAEYAALFPTLIRSWRKAWGQGNFPFLYVQLAPHSGKWELLREVQLKTLAVPNTAMAVITDSDRGIHPTKKQLPGGRLALAARAIAYGEKIVYSGPIIDSAKFDDGKAVLNFKHVGGGLKAGGDELTGFEIAGANGKFVPAEAKIDGDTVVVSSKSVAKPAQVRYAWAPAPKCNLFNKEGLPASPFRTEEKKKD